MMRVVVSIFLSLLVSFSFAQKNKRPNYDLLWQISGNGLSKPSYLFGTMHVQDNRAFNFNDSLLAKVIQCEAFAMEVHPDSMTHFFASILLEESTHQSIESQMTTADFRYYDSLMKKHTGLSLKKFRNVQEAMSFVEYRGLRKDKNTFVDAWLYNIARDNNKTIVGLESSEAQMALLQRHDSTHLRQFKAYLNSGKFESNDVSRSLLDIYYEGSIETVFKFMKSNTSPDYFKKLIVDRNVVMTSSIIREIHQHTTFIAVGAGHLGGTPGVVNLLREKGYVVTPVSAPFSGTAAKYKSTSISTEKWFTFSSDDGGYSVEMPQAPIPLKLKELPFSFQTYFDVGTLSVYMAAHLPLGVALKNQSPSKMLDAMVKSMEGRGNLSAKKKITIDGYEGRELEAAIAGSYFKVRIVIKEMNVYMLMAGPSKESVDTPDAKRFLSSLKMKAPAQSKVASFVDNEGAFSADMPGKVMKQLSTPTDPTSNKKLALHIFYSADNSTGSTYLVRYNDFPAGYVCVDDSLYIHNTLQAVSEAMKGTDLSSDSVNFHGIPSTHFKFQNGDHRVTVEGQLLLRGERFYLIMSERGNAGGDEASQSFFDSFQFLPYQTPTLKRITLPDGITLDVPEYFERDSTMIIEKDTKQYAFVDPSSSMMFSVLRESFSNYRQSENATVYFKNLGEKYKIRNGRLMKDSVIAPLIHDYLIQSKRSNAIIKLRAVIAGRSLVTLWGYLPKDYQKYALVDKVFESFSVKSDTDWSLFSDKIDLILADVSSSDSTIRENAAAALDEYPLRSNHLPKVYQALKKSYPDDGEWYGIRATLLKSLNKIHDNSTEAFIETLYPSLPDSVSLKEDALGVLSSIKTVHSVKKMADLLTNDSSSHRFNSAHLVNPLVDSLSLLNDVALNLLHVLPKFKYSARLLEVIKMALDSNAFEPSRRSDIISSLVNAASKMADTHLPANDSELSIASYNKYAMAEALSSVPFTSQVQDIIRKFASDDDDDLKFVCLQVQLKNNAGVSQADVDRLSAHYTMRLLLYDELVKHNKLQLMSRKYQTTEMLAAGEVYESLSYEDETPEKITFLKEKKVIVNGEKKKILVFTFRYEGGKDDYIAIAGPYSPGVAFKRGDLTTSFYQKYEGEKPLKEKLTEYFAEHDVVLID